MFDEPFSFDIMELRAGATVTSLKGFKFAANQTLNGRKESAEKDQKGVISKLYFHC